ncbi:MAG: heavy metal-responsive transcriptional regulator [Gammaproteobacteria bacterium]|nr:heavy metal-responsive transcriptional regulator [Gammaproteobacteria bacterium]
MIQIGDVAKRSGIGVGTVRFYEREGLISLPDRSPSGYRRYPESVVKQIRFIQHAKTLGFSLREINELINLKNHPGSTCKNVKLAAIAKIKDIQRKIDALEKMKMALTPLIKQCQPNKPISDCPILNVVDENTLLMAPNN